MGYGCFVRRVKKSVAAVQTFITAAGGPWFVSPASIGTNNGQIYGEAILRLTALPAAAITLFGLSAVQVSLQIIPSGAIRVSALKGSNNVTALVTANPATITPHLLTAGTRHVITWAIDLPGLWLKLWVDGELALDLTLASNTGLFDTTRVWSFLATNTGGATQVIGTIERLRLWQGVTSNTITPPVTAPIKSIGGPASAVNSDRVSLGVTTGWTTGSDAAAP